MASGSPPEGGKRVAPGKRSVARGWEMRRYEALKGRQKGTTSATILSPLPGLLLIGTAFPGLRFACPGLLAVRPSRARARWDQYTWPFRRLLSFIRSLDRQCPFESHRQRRWFTLLELTITASGHTEPSPTPGRQVHPESSQIHVRSEQPQNVLRSTYQQAARGINAFCRDSVFSDFFLEAMTAFFPFQRRRP